MTSDHELLAAWRAGDRNAGSSLFERHLDAVRRFFRGKTDQHVEDLVQRTFIACVEARDRFRGAASFRTYLFGIAHNVLREHIRHQRRAAADLDLDLDLVSIADPAASPTSMLAAHAEERQLLHSLQQLPVASQVILELYYWEQMTGAELGAFLGVPEDTARTRLRKARQQLESVLRHVEGDLRRHDGTPSGLDQWAAGLRAQVTAAR